MARVLHDNATSANAQKVRFLLREIGVPFARRHVALTDERPAWHVRINPLGTVPALIDGSVRVGESNAILRYLASRHGRADLYPLSLPDRARVDWMLDAISGSLRPALRHVEHAVYGLRVGRGLFAEQPSDDGGVLALEQQIPALRRFAKLLDDEHGFACLGQLTLADIAAAPSLHRLERSGLPLAGLERLERWAAAVLSRPAWASVAAEAGV